MTDLPETAATLVAFWTRAGRERWFTPDAAFDEACRTRFGALYEEAAAGHLAAWEATAEGALALVLLLDQIPRNIHRQDPRTWATDRQALAIADRAIDRGFDQVVVPDLRALFLLPFTHSERLIDQDRSVALYEDAGDADGVQWARHHRDIVARFGRFPHRNAVLGRETTPGEQACLADDPFRG